MQELQEEKCFKPSLVKKQILDLPFLENTLLYTLASGIDVGPTFINFGFFSRPFGLIREYIHKGYLDGYLLHRTCAFKALVS